MNRLISFFVLLVIAIAAQETILWAQKEVRSLERKGNKHYRKGDLSKAEIEYRKALEINRHSPEATYNLANTLIKTSRLEEAQQKYTELLEQPGLSREKRADAAHNLGNSFMAAKKYSEAIEAYKQSLIARPSDHETRYNLALAQKLLQQQQQDQQQNKQNQQQQDKQEQQDQQKDQQPQNDKKDKTQEQQQDKPEQMSKDNAQKILDAFLKDEKNTQQKVEKAKQLQNQGNKNKKNW